MYEKKLPVFKSPDLNKLQSVKVDIKTTIYIAVGADPVKAKNRFLEQVNAKYVKK